MFAISKALRWVCYLALTVSITAFLNPFIAVARGKYDGSDLLIGGIIVTLFFAGLAAGVYRLSRLQLEARQSGSMLLVRPVVWIFAVLIALLCVRMLLSFFVGQQVFSRHLVAIRSALLIAWGNGFDLRIY